MDSIKSTKARHDDDGPVDITLRESSEKSEPNPNCDDSSPDLSVTCENISLGECYQGKENELFDSAENNQADGRAGVAISAGSSDDPCRQITTTSSSSDKTCLAGGSSGMAITGASVEGSEDGIIADIARPVENSKVEVPKKRAVRATLAAYRDENRKMYWLPIKSPLGQEYKKLVTRQEKSEFMVKHGMSREDASRALRQLEQEQA